jgi:hypothetical protein
MAYHNALAEGHTDNRVTKMNERAKC